MSKGKFWLRGSYVINTGNEVIFWKLPQGQFILNCELPPQSQVKCSFLDIVTNCVRVKTGWLSAIWISGDAMITLYNMDHKKDPNLKELLSSNKTEIKSKYQDLLTNHPEFFDASEMKKRVLINMQRRRKRRKKKEILLRVKKRSLYGRLMKAEKQIEELSNIEISQVTEYKKLVINNEENIVKKGNEEKSLSIFED